MSRDPVRVWAVTGPAGAGKSTATGVLAADGVPVVDGDALGHEILARPEIQALIAARIGARFVGPGGVDRAALGHRVFSDPAALAALNGITHGPLAALAAARLRDLAATGIHELAVFEAAVYFLLPSPPPVDLVVVVTAAPEIRVARLVAREDGRLSVAAARVRVEAQAALETDWRTRADRVIVNDGDRAALAAAVRELYQHEFPGREHRT